MTFRFLVSVLVLAGVSGCGPSYSPDTYASNAAQQANKVEQGIIVGVRTVSVSAAGTVGAVTGAAAGGIAGSQVGAGPISAISALGGSLVGGIAGSTVEHVEGDTTAFEYIIRKPNGDLVSVTQKDKTPLVLGQKVLVIAGTQARVVPDYTVPAVALAPRSGATVKADPVTAGSKPGDTKPAGAQAAGTAPAGATPAAVPPGGGTPAGVPANAATSAAVQAGGSSSASPPAAGTATVPAPIILHPSSSVVPAATMPVAIDAATAAGHPANAAATSAQAAGSAQPGIASGSGSLPATVVTQKPAVATKPDSPAP